MKYQGGQPKVSRRHHVRESPDGTPPSATDRVYDALRRDILSCKLPPGTRILEGELADHFEVSKTPVKRALGMLMHEGFVEVRPRHGYRVTEISLADVQEIYQLRQVVEPAAAELAAANASPEQLQELRRLVEESTKDSYEQKVDKVLRFHEILAEASGNDRLSAVIGGLMDEMECLLSLGLDIEKSVSVQASEHRELLDALLKGNHHSARTIAEHQVEVGRMRMFEAILESLTGTGGAADQVVLRPMVAPPVTKP
ncbi:MAG: GntR family transcriptional regulator [Actinomycetota bacterium]|nr:GntR family transcriptional regulator [Actinomycetota bacterium]